MVFDFVDLYVNQGLSVYKISRLTGRSVTHVWVSLKKEGVALRSRKKHLSDEETEAVLGLFYKGATVKAIHKAFSDLPRGAVHRALVSHLCEMSLSKLSVSEIARKTGRSKQSISRLLTGRVVDFPSGQTSTFGELNSFYNKERWSRAEIADHFGCSVSYLEKTFKLAGITKKKESPLISKSALKDALMSGWSIEDIAEEFDVAASTVSSYKKRYGLLGYQFETLFLDKEQLEDLYVTQGLSQSDVAESLGVSEWTVSKYVGKYGLRKKRRKSSVKLVLEMKGQGLSVSQIADHLSLSKRSVYRYLKGSGDGSSVS